MSKPMIVIDRLVKTYGLNPVLRGVSLEIPAGQFVTLVGPNGAGKTTILRILATLLAPTAGSVAVGGWTLPGNARRVRPYIGLVSHQSLLYGDLTAAENLNFFARLYGGEIEAGAIDGALRRVGLAARARDPVGTFSRGMVQRLTIARATLHRPEVLLLDEPYTGLDQDAAAILDDLLEEERAAGRTILMITHNLLRAANLSDRVVILSQGKIQHDLLTDTLDTAEFLELYAMATRRRRKNRQHES
jgi:heme exporter protein A